MKYGRDAALIRVADSPDRVRATFSPARYR
jgi:hypothetical protein